MQKIEELFGLKTGELASMFMDIGVRIAIAIAILIVGFWQAQCTVAVTVLTTCAMRSIDTTTPWAATTRTLTS